jgi:hypothetical protein
LSGSGCRAAEARRLSYQRRGRHQLSVAADQGKGIRTIYAGKADFCTIDLRVFCSMKSFHPSQNQHPNPINTGEFAVSNRIAPFLRHMPVHALHSIDKSPLKEA